MISSTLSQVPFYYLRHGETNWNIERRVMGRQDVPLNTRGESDSTNVASSLQNRAIKTICHSPLKRAKKTAELINETLKCPLIEVDELTECCWGELEGKVVDQGWVTDWMNGDKIDGAETYHEFLLRCLVGLNKALNCEGPILIVAHGIVYCSVQFFTHTDKKFHLPNCIPVFHKPPIDAAQPWKTTLLT